MNELIWIMADTLKRVKNDPVVCRNWMSYVTHCLVPAAVHRLIMEDLGQSSEAAFRTQMDSAELGRIFNDDDVVEV